MNLKTFYKDKNVFVTGGAGFIGSNIAEQLCLHGAKVTILDDLSSGSLDNLHEIKSSIPDSEINLIASDICSYKNILKATKGQEIVFHTAALVSVPQSIKYPALCEKINIDGTYNLLEACKINNIQTFIFSSSASVYGEKTEKCHEDDLPNPQSPYAKSKLLGEKLCKEYARDHKINTASLRYFNVYGPRQSFESAYSGVVAKFKHNLLNGKAITIYGNGKQKRDFIHVSQVALANLLIGSCTNLGGEIFNIATGRSVTLLEMLSQLEKDTNRKNIEILFQPARKGDIFSSQADCKKFERLKKYLM
jgi:UDP-glucose 4-epimerase